MGKYTYKDIIIDPTSEEAKNCIGKEVYFSDSPYGCLESANNHEKCSLSILESIDEDAVYCPFNIKNHYCKNHIILKREDCEPKTEYVPFESADEFIDAYGNTLKTIDDSSENNLLHLGGIWLKRKCDSVLIAQCIEISDKGIVLGINHQTTFWDDLLDDYQFLDGTPCGKLKEVEE